VTFASRITDLLLTHCKQHFNLAKILLGVTLRMGEQGQCVAENNTLEQTFFCLARTVQRKFETDLSKALLNINCAW
jgi:hypothetical protein